VLATLQTGTPDDIAAALKAATSLAAAEVIELAALCKTHDDNKLRKLAKQVLDKLAPAAGAALAAAMKSLASDDAKVTKQLRALEAAGFPDVPAFAAVLVDRTSDHRGLAYLCEHGGPLARRALEAATDAEGRLDLGGFKHIPAELADLDRVRSLSLYGCGLKVLPDAVLALRKLVHLNLSRNRLVTLPDEIAQLASLEELVLHDVPLGRGLGAGLCRLPKLRDLWVIRANFKSLPDDIGDLADSLERLLIVQCRKLQTFPASFAKLVHLKHLEIDHCDVIDAIPSAVWSMRELEHLDLSGTTLGRIPETLGDLRALKELQLRGCEFELPRSIGSCASLETLDMVFGKVDDLPESFYALPALARLRIQYSPLETTHRSRIVERMPNVKIYK